MSGKFTENAAKYCSRAISLFFKSRGGRSPSFEVFKLDMYVLDPKIYLFPVLYLCMRFVGWDILELLHYNKLWTDGQTEWLLYVAPASSMAGP